VAVVRVSGTDLGRRLEPLLRLPPARAAVVRVLRWGGYQERALVLHFPAPASYTGEDVVEFQLHGNPLLVRRFLEHLGTLGIRLAEPGEFTRRALLNGKQGLLEAEALRDLVAAASDTQLRHAMARLGIQPEWLQRARQTLVPWIARAEAAVDYGEDEDISPDHGALRAALVDLRATFHVEHRRSEAARWLRDGIRVAITGRPNAGKSTLFNALAGEDRAIVTEFPGTTRDVLEVRAEFAGLPLLLFDTAGLREAVDPAERLGVDRVAGVLERADLILHLVPATDAESGPDLQERLLPFADRILEVRTFGDRAGPSRPTGITVSAPQGDLDALARALNHRFLGPLGPDACLGALATARQRELLAELQVQADLLLDLEETAPAEVVASGLQGLWGLLARLTGEDRAESTLDQVFSGFCLGK
jgi:tRNA modification GTPase